MSNGKGKVTHKLPNTIGWRRFFEELSTFVKVIKDPIHGYFRLNRLEVKIMDTNYLQRLRYISQSPTSYLTYPTSRTSRFEHSLGV